MLSAALVYDDVQRALLKSSPIFTNTSKWFDKGATLSPKAVPVLRKLMPLLQVAPQLAPLVAYVSSSAATILKEAPQYTHIVNETIDLLAKMPEVAEQVAGPLHKLAEITKSAANDPALPKVIDRLNKIIALHKGPIVPTPPTTKLPIKRTAALNLREVLPALDAYIFVKKYPWVLWAGPILATVLVGSIGFIVGRKL